MKKLRRRVSRNAEYADKKASHNIWSAVVAVAVGREKGGRLETAFHQLGSGSPSRS